MPVKRAQMYKHVEKYVGDGKPEAPMHWPKGAGAPEILSVEELKKQYFFHQGQQIANQWLKKDTAKALFDAKLANHALKGIDASCVKPPAAVTVDAYHSTLMSIVKTASHKEVSLKTL